MYQSRFPRILLACADDDKDVEAILSARNLVNTEQRRMKNKKKMNLNLN